MHGKNSGVANRQNGQDRTALEVRRGLLPLESLAVVGASESVRWIQLTVAETLLELFSLVDADGDDGEGVGARGG